MQAPREEPSLHPRVRQMLEADPDLASLVKKNPRLLQPLDLVVSELVLGSGCFSAMSTVQGSKLHRRIPDGSQQLSESYVKEAALGLLVFVAGLAEQQMRGYFLGCMTASAAASLVQSGSQ